jgi:hypothetical protein
MAIAGLILQQTLPNFREMLGETGALIFDGFEVVSGLGMIGTSTAIAGAITAGGGVAAMGLSSLSAPLLLAAGGGVAIGTTIYNRYRVGIQSGIESSVSGYNSAVKGTTRAIEATVNFFND